MALTDKKYEKFYKITGTGDDKITSNELSFAEEMWDLDRAIGMRDHFDNPELAPIVFQLQQMQDEIDYLRTEISTNKDKVIPNVTGTANHAISFGALRATTVKGKTTYSVVMTVTDSSGAKALVKTVILTLA
tara:strand:+ start:8440 stop:8835 length:396 start_codon:yes stop_codon:yes gene_type:complete